MECLEAQRLISEALDGARDDADALAEAKEHCRSCADCNAFVRGLVAVRRAETPEPPPDLADRVMARVRQEAENVAVESAAAATAPPPTMSLADEAASLDRLTRQARDPRNRRTLIAWAAAAAVVFVAAGFAAVAGVRQILIPAQTASEPISVTIEDYGARDGAAQTAPEAGGPGGTGSAQSGLPSTAGAPPFVVIDGEVYRLLGPAGGVVRATLTEVGTTTSALDTGKAPTRRDVLGGEDLARVYVPGDDGSLLSFERVTRTYEGVPYVLESGSIDAFGTWPTLPAGIARPTAADGSPTFARAGADDRGVAVYRLAGSTSRTGIALAPSPPEGDVLAGSPDWTWWVPLQD